MTLFTEAIKLSNGEYHHLDYHQARMDRTAASFYGTRIDLRATLREIPSYAVDGLFKCRVVYGPQVVAVEYMRYEIRTVSTVAIVEDDTVHYRYKYADRTCLDQLRQGSGCDDIIIVRQGRVTDASFSNLVFVSGGHYDTPTDCLLPGTRRQYLLDTGRIREKIITPDDISNYERVLFINAMIGIEDNSGIDTAAILGR